MRMHWFQWERVANIDAFASKSVLCGISDRCTSCGKGFGLADTRSRPTPEKHAFAVLVWRPLQECP